MDSSWVVWAIKPYGPRRALRARLSTGLFQASQGNRTHGTRKEGSELESLSLATFDRAVALNLRGTLVTLQAAVPVMKRQGADALSSPLPSR